MSESSVVIIASAEDVPAAVRHANRNHGARDYVAKRAAELGQASAIPPRWGITAGIAKRIVKKAIGAALSWDPSLHPRGRDGRFIHKLGSVNVYDAPGATKPTIRGTSVGLKRGPDGKSIISVEVSKDGSFKGKQYKAGDVIETDASSIGEAKEPKARMPKGSAVADEDRGAFSAGKIKALNDEQLSAALDMTDGVDLANNPDLAAIRQGLEMEASNRDMAFTPADFDAPGGDGDDDDFQLTEVADEADLPEDLPEGTDGAVETAWDRFRAARETTENPTEALETLSDDDLRRLSEDPGVPNTVQTEAAEALAARSGSDDDGDDFILREDPDPDSAVLRPGDPGYEDDDPGELSDADVAGQEWKSTNEEALVDLLGEDAYLDLPDNADDLDAALVAMETEFGSGSQLDDFVADLRATRGDQSGDTEGTDAEFADGDDIDDGMTKQPPVMPEDQAYADYEEKALEAAREAGMTDEQISEALAADSEPVFMDDMEAGVDPGDAGRSFAEGASGEDASDEAAEGMPENHPARQLEDLASEMRGAESGVPATAQAELSGIADRHAAPDVDDAALAADLAEWRGKWGDRTPSATNDAIDEMIADRDGGDLEGPPEAEDIDPADEISDYLDMFAVGSEDPADYADRWPEWEAYAKGVGDGELLERLGYLRPEVNDYSDEDDADPELEAQVWLEGYGNERPDGDTIDAMVSEANTPERKAALEQHVNDMLDDPDFATEMFDEYTSTLDAAQRHGFRSDDSFEDTGTGSEAEQPSSGDVVGQQDMLDYFREEGHDIDPLDISSVVDAHPDWDHDRVFAEVERNLDRAQNGGWSDDDYIEGFDPMEHGPNFDALGAALGVDYDGEPSIDADFTDEITEARAFFDMAEGGEDFHYHNAAQTLRNLAGETDNPALTALIDGMADAIDRRNEERTNPGGEADLPQPGPDDSFVLGQTPEETLANQAEADGPDVQVQVDEAAKKILLMVNSANKASVAITPSETNDRLNEEVLNAESPEDAHKAMARLMTELKLGGKQRKRYREFLDAYFGTGGDDSAKTQAAEVAANLPEDNPLKQRLAEKASGPVDGDGDGETGDAPIEFDADGEAVGDAFITGPMTRTASETYGAGYEINGVDFYPNPDGDGWVDGGGTPGVRPDIAERLDARLAEDKAREEEFQIAQSSEASAPTPHQQVADELTEAGWNQGSSGGQKTWTSPDGGYRVTLPANKAYPNFFEQVNGKWRASTTFKPLGPGYILPYVNQQVAQAKPYVDIDIEDASDEQLRVWAKALAKGTMGGWSKPDQDRLAAELARRSGVESYDPATGPSAAQKAANAEVMFGTPAPTIETPGPVAAPPAPQPGAVIYRHPQGAVIYVNPDGSMEAYGKDGKPKKTSATPEKLAAGHGQWKAQAPEATSSGPVDGDGDGEVGEVPEVPEADAAKVLESLADFEAQMAENDAEAGSGNGWSSYARDGGGIELLKMRRESAERGIADGEDWVTLKVPSESEVSLPADVARTVLRLLDEHGGSVDAVLKALREGKA